MNNDANPFAILCEENTHIDLSSLQPKSSAAALLKKVRDGGFIRLLLEFFMNVAHAFKLINSSGSFLC